MLGEQLFLYSTLIFFKCVVPPLVAALNLVSLDPQLYIWVSSLHTPFSRGVCKEAAKQ